MKIYIIIIIEVSKKNVFQCVFFMWIESHMHAERASERAKERKRAGASSETSTHNGKNNNGLKCARCGCECVLCIVCTYVCVWHLSLFASACNDNDNGNNNTIAIVSALGFSFLFHRIECAGCESGSRKMLLNRLILPLLFAYCH